MFAILCLALHVSEYAGQSREYELQGSCDSCDVPQRSCANNSKAEKADLVQARKSACKASEYVKDSPNLSEPATIEKLMTLPNDI